MGLACCFSFSTSSGFPLRKRAYGINVVTGTETPIAEPVLRAPGYLACLVSLPGW